MSLSMTDCYEWVWVSGFVHNNKILTDKGVCASVIVYDHVFMAWPIIKIKISSLLLQVQNCDESHANINDET